MKKRTFLVKTDFVTESFVVGVDRSFDGREFNRYIRDALPKAALLAMLSEKGNPRFANTKLEIKNVEVAYKNGVNRAQCPTKLISIYFDTYCNQIPSSLKTEVKYIIKNFDQTLSPPLFFFVKERVF